MKARPPIDAVSVAAVGVAGSAAGVLAGWGLTLAGRLGAAGYGVALGLATVAGLVAAMRGGGFTIRWRPQRWCRGWPGLFVALAGLTALGGLLHAPSNIDALTYRLPRVLHWLEAGRWHWIDTGPLRMNYSATAAEWLAAPVLALSGSARPLFLINALCFLLLPGLLFVWLRGLGAGGRVAWRWMWLAPGALGFALQAGSVANDLLGVGYFLAGMVFAQRAERTGKAGWFLLGAVALGLATNVKTSNLALVPMGLVFLRAASRALPGRRVPTACLALLLGGAVSAGPTLILNAVHSGSWTGDPANLTALQPGSTVAAVMGNAAVVSLQNLAPPFFPWAGAWNAWADSVLLQGWREFFGASGFPRLTFRLGELPQEEWAGLGLGVCALLALEAWRARGRRRRLPESSRTALWAGAAGALVFFVTMGSEMPARLLLPFYLVPIGVLAARAPDANLHRNGYWRALAVVTMSVALLAVILTPARPLFPAADVWAWLEARWPADVFARAERVYRVYAERPDALRALRKDLPGDERQIGFLATDDDSEWSLWQPIGSRRVTHVSSLAEARARGLRVVVVRGDIFLADAAAENAALAATGFRVAARHELVVKAARPAERWMVAVRER